MAHTHAGEPYIKLAQKGEVMHGPHARGRTSINYPIDIRWLESVGLVLLNLEVGA